MLKVNVWTKEYDYNNEEYYCRTALIHLRPRTYMCGWTFEKMLEYTKKELEWEEIEKEKITSFEIQNEKMHWIQQIRRSKVN